MKFPLILSCFTMALAAYGQGLPALVQKPIDEYERFKAEQLQEVEARITVKREALIRDLKARMPVEARAGNLNVALELKTKIEELEKEQSASSVQAAEHESTSGAAHANYLDFEHALPGWENLAPPIVVSAEAAHSGKFGLRYIVTGDAKQKFPFLPFFPIKPDGNYRLHFWARSVSGGGMRVKITFNDAQGRYLTSSDTVGIPSEATGWAEYQIIATAPKGAARTRMSFNPPATATTVDFDDVSITEIKKE